MPEYPKEKRNSANDVSSYTYLYAYVGDNSGNTMAVLKPSQKTAAPLFNKVIFCNAREDDELPGSQLNIQIDVFGIQTDFLKSSDETETEAEKVWRYLKK